MGLLALGASLAAREAGAEPPETTWLNTLAGGAGDGLSAAPGSYGGSAYGGAAGGRLDWLSELELTADGVGLRASALAAAGDLYRYPSGPSAALYLEGTRPYVTAAAPSVRHAEIEFLDAFLHDTVAFGDDQRLTVRLGRHTLIWGESLYFPQNGIAGGQSPVDLTRLRPLDFYGAKEQFLPVGQASFTWQPNGTLALEGYVPFEFRPSLVSAAGLGAYATDRLAPADAAWLAALSGGQPAGFVRGTEALPAPFGRYGLALKWQAGGLDAGLYALRSDAECPIPVFRGTIAGAAWEYLPVVGRYDLRYPTGIEIYGASVAGFLGDVDLAAELSGRRHQPLVTAGVVLPAWGGSPPIPTGDTLQGQLSWTYVTPPLPGIPAGASWTGEIAANEVTAAANADHLMPGRSRFAGALRTVLEPQFYQVVPRLDLSLPIGLGYGLWGRSAVDPTMTRGVGDIDIGIALRADQLWKASLGYTHYLGRSRALYLPYSQTAAADPLAAGDFVALTVERSF